MGESFGILGKQSDNDDQHQTQDQDTMMYQNTTVVPFIDICIAHYPCFGFLQMSYDF